MLDRRLQRHFGFFDKDLAVRSIPCRYQVTPPELARGLDVLQSVEIGVLPAARYEPGSSFAHRFQPGLSQGLVNRQPGLHRHAAAVPMRDHVLVRLNFVEQACLFDDAHDDLASLETILALQFIPAAMQGGGTIETFEEILIVLEGDPRIGRQVLTRRRPATLANFRVVEFMRRGRLDCARSDSRVRRTSIYGSAAPAKLAAGPPAPVKIVGLPKPLPLPGQLKPLASGKTTPEAANPTVRVNRANSAARISRCAPASSTPCKSIQFERCALSGLYRAWPDHRRRATGRRAACRLRTARRRGHGALDHRRYRERRGRDERSIFWSSRPGRS